MQTEVIIFSASHGFFPHNTCMSSNYVLYQMLYIMLREPWDQTPKIKSYCKVYKSNEWWMLREATQEYQ